MGGTFAICILVADRDYLNGDRWFTVDVADATDSIINYGRDIVG